MDTTDPRVEAAWTALERHHAQIRDVHLRELMAADPGRFERFSIEVGGLLVDFAKHRATERTLSLLVDFARALGLEERMRDLFAGQRVNTTEDRPALHMALRHPGDAPFPAPDRDVMPQVMAVRERMAAIADAVRGGSWRGFSGEPIRRVVNIGIGGSDLGPAMVTHALRAYHREGLSVEFVSNVDSAQLGEVLSRCRPETTLFIVASKTFATQETLLNATSARAWLRSAPGAGEAAVARHFVAVSSHPARTAEFGIAPENVLEMWDWVGGRYSLWSAVGLAICIATGPRRFDELLAGAWAMDRHFREAPLAVNAPVVLGLLGFWYRSLFAAATHVVLPYDVALERLPAHLQQVEMESNGKSVTGDGRPLPRLATPVLWGGAGNNGQHAFYQKLHQGGELVPADIIVPVRSQHPLTGHEDAVIANALAQSEALMLGRTATEARAALRGGGLHGPALEAAVPHRVSPGNQPTTVIVYERLSPRILGTLVALYEHRTFVQGVCWQVNPFDQWGVELGKALASAISAEVASGAPGPSHDPSTTGLLRHVGRAREEGT